MVGVSGSGSRMHWELNINVASILKPSADLNTLRTGDADLRFQHGEAQYICKFSLVPLHKGECFQRYPILKHY